MSRPQDQASTSQGWPALGRHNAAHPGYSKDNNLFFSANNVPYVKLCFTKKSIVNSVIILNEAPYFKVSTMDAAGAVTNLKDARTGALLSTINRRMLRPDTVTFPNRYKAQPKKMKEWLVKSGTLAAETWTVQAGAYTLKMYWDDNIRNRLLLCKDGDREHMGWFEPATPTEPFTLFIRDGMQEDWDLIATAVIAVLHKRLLEDSAAATKEAYTGAYVEMTKYNGFTNL